MIWNDVMIRDWAMAGGVSPFVAENVNPASIDLRWSGRVRFAQHTGDLWSPVVEAEELVLYGGQLVLLDTLEYVNMPETAAGSLMLKSSMGRKGLEHLHAGYFDPGFEGTATLEITNMHPQPVTLKRGDRIVQLVMMAMTAPPIKSYQHTGRYNGQTSPEPSREKRP